MTRTFWLAPLLASSGCFESIAPERPDAGIGLGASEVGPPGPFATTRGTDGTYTTVVDAQSATEWTYGDFETGASSDPTGPWDLRFQRFHISTNGGISGAGGVEVAPITGVAFADVLSLPATGWTSDAPDGDDANTDPDYAFEQGDGWYEYDPTTHVLRPRPIVWVVKTTDGAMLKLELASYYDDAGTAGWFTFRWAPL